MKKLLIIFALTFSFSAFSQTPWNYVNMACVDPFENCVHVTTDFVTFYPSWAVRDTTAFRIYTDSVLFYRWRSIHNDGAPTSICWAANDGEARRTAITGTPSDGWAIVYEASTGKLKYANVSASALPSMTGNSGKYLTNNGTSASWSDLPGSNRSTAYSAGTSYTLTTSAAKIDFSTTDPVITIPQPGTYMIYSNIKIEYAGLTTALNACNFKIRRTNNTAADIANGSTNFNVPVATLLTGTGGDVDIPVVVYTTSNSNDVLELWGNRSGGITLGSIQVGEASIVAVRIQ